MALKVVTNESLLSVSDRFDNSIVSQPSGVRIWSRGPQAVKKLVLGREDKNLAGLRDLADFLLPKQHNKATTGDTKTCFSRNFGRRAISSFFRISEE